jgi:hypothetical protein
MKAIRKAVTKITDDQQGRALQILLTILFISAMVASIVFE